MLSLLLSLSVDAVVVAIVAVNFSGVVDVVVVGVADVIGVCS